MTPGPVYVELCAGTASVALWALGRCAPPVGYMGSKRVLASTLCELLGIDRTPPARVVLVDGGPWGDAWSVLRDRDLRRGVIELLRSWNGLDPHDLWETLVSFGPPTDPVARVAQYLWLQARSAGTIPIWWNEERWRWESPTGSRTEGAHGRGGGDARRRGTNDQRQPHGASNAAGRQKQRAPNRPVVASATGPRMPDRPYEAGALDRRRATRGGVAVQKGSLRLLDHPNQRGRSVAPRGNPHSIAGPVEVDSSEGKVARVLELRADGELAARWRAGCRGIQYPETVARRLEALDRIDWDRVEVFHGPIEAFQAIHGSRVYIDPPYAGCPRYACTLPRETLLAVCRRQVAGGARVLVSEGEPLPIAGWSAQQLVARKIEWVTASWPMRAAQLPLFPVLEVPPCR